MKKSFALLSVIRNRAKQLQKEKSLKWNQALDASANEFGFSNFKNYKNISETNIKQYKSAVEVLLSDISSENDMPKKTELALSFNQNHKTSFRDLLEILKQFQHSEEAIQLMCEKLSLLKEEIKTFLFNEFLTDEGQYEINFRAPYFIAKEISLSDLTYEINEDILCIDGQYVLTTKFDFETIALVNEEDRKDARFNDRKFDGSFGVEIDMNKKITIEHSDMSTDSIDNKLTPRSGFTGEEIEDYYRRFPDERGQFDDILVLDKGNYGKIKQSLSKNKPLKGKALELALGLVDVHGDDEQSRFIKNIGVKLKAGQPLGDYEYHILVDVLMLHAQLGS